MNNRIKLLAEQAGLKVPVDTEYNSHIYRYALERFANSIVRECTSICEELGNDGLDGHYCADEIKNHFKEMK